MCESDAREEQSRGECDVERPDVALLENSQLQSTQGTFMATALIGLYNFERISASTWLVQFEIEIQGCNQATGDFSYRIVVKNSNHVMYTLEKKSEPYTPADGRNFIFDVRENLPKYDEIISVDKIKSLLCRCETKIQNRNLPYLKDFDPYEACHHHKVVQSKSIIGAIGVLYELAIIYSALSEGSASNDIDKFLKKATDALEKISKTLSDIEDQLDEISDLIRNLPEKIRGIFEASTIKYLLAQADGYAQLIAEKTRSQNILVVLPELVMAVDQLQVTLNSLVLYKGLAGYLIISPYLAIWLAGAACIQKVRMRFIVGYEPDSPWQGSLMTSAKAGLLSLTEEMDRVNIKYQQSLIPSFPRPLSAAVIYVNVVHEIAGEYFVRRTVSRVYPGMIRLACKDQVSGQLSIDELQVAVAGTTGGNPDLPDPLKVSWKSIDLNNLTSPVEKRFYAVYSRLERDRLEVQSFFRWTYEISRDRAKLFQPFTEPADFWR
jgi:hypothetical protein